MRSQIQVGSILIDDLPMIARALGMETESYSTSWSLVLFPEARVLDRKLVQLNGVFFMAAEVKAGLLRCDSGKIFVKHE